MKHDLLRTLTRFLSLCAGAVFIVSACQAQDAGAGDPPDSEGKPDVAVRAIDVRANESDEVYRVFMRIPEGPAPAGGFPVIYLLDGNWFFEIARATSALLMAVGDMPPTVIVGIGYPDGETARIRRFHDFTDAAEHPVPERMAGWGIQPGGRDAFTAFLVDELPAVVAERAEIDRDCTALFGHSLGGLFALDLLFRRPRAFTDFAIGDAAIWWDEYAVMEGEGAFLEGPLRDVVGELFLAHSTAGKFEYLDRFAAFAERVESRAGDGGRVTVKSYRLDTHNSMMAGFLSTAMTRLPSCARMASE